MKYLKKYKTFNEDGTATVGATTAGMGAVSNAQPGALAGTTGTEGSGDVGFTFKKEKRKKGETNREKVRRKNQRNKNKTRTYTAYFI